ncbi:helix-turn-helix domain-containing protein [Bradyrhizobium sp. 26S5]|uniref:helix-turn-helix domain-containing protein n=1 Tax=Bradyrhizobium sp. 26S5 TaxID=3139729 RepID=UPI0030D45D7B
MTKSVQCVSVAGPRGLAIWREQIYEQFRQVELARPVSGQGFRARLRIDAASTVQTCRVAGSSQAVRRPARACGHEFGIMKVVRGNTRLEQGGVVSELGPSDIVLFDNSRPYTLDMSSSFEHALLLVDRKAWAPEIAEIETQPLGRLPDTAAARILAGMLETMVRLAPAMDADEFERVALPLTQLAAASLDRRSTESPTRSQISAALFKRICGDIRARLADPDLAPGELARRHGVSLRYLHKLFAQHGLSVMQFVRNQRLAQCASELRACAGRPHVGLIAARWGFNDDATFRRAFRARYGINPTAFANRT